MRQATREKIMALISQLINVAELSGRFDAKGFTRITELEEITRLRAEIANLVSENSPALLTPEAVDGGLVERELIGGLVDGIRWWAAQEDGIPQEVCKAFNDAMGYLGWEYSTQVDTDALANQPAPDSPVDVGEVAEAIAWLRRVPSCASPPTDEAIADLIESLAQELTESKAESALLKDKWVPVGERLPEPNPMVPPDTESVTVLLFAPPDYIGIGLHYRGSHGHYWAGTTSEYDISESVTHWMPLPEPPVKQGGEKL